MGSSIKINSISKDLVGCNDEIDTGKCEHFSIRGFVSEIRERDWKNCWPFPLNLVSEDQIQALPPLCVPKSRWWRCESCLRDINAEGNRINLMLLSDCQLPQSSKALEERKTQANANVVQCKTDLQASMCSEKKQENAKVGIMHPIAGNDLDKNENTNRDNCPKDETAASLKKDCCSSLVSCIVRNCSKQNTNITHASRKSQGKVETSKEIAPVDNCNVRDEQNAEVMEAFRSSDIAGVVDDTPKGTKKRKTDNLSKELDKCDDVSSASGILARILHVRNPNNGIGSHRRKLRKVRLISELLGKPDAKTRSMRSQDYPSKRDLVKGKKRKLSKDVEWRPAGMFPQNNYVNRKFKTIEKSSENSTQSCDSESNSLSGVGLQRSLESESTENGFDRDPIKGKKKNKRFQVVDEHLSGFSWENSQKDMGENDEDSDKGNANENTLSNAVHSAFKCRELVPCSLHAQKTEGNPTLYKKKMQVPLIDNKKKSVITFSNGILDENLVQSRKTEGLQRKPVNIQVRDVSNVKELDLSRGNLLASDRYTRKYIPQLKKRSVFSLPWQEVPLKDQVAPKKVNTNHFEDLGLSSKQDKGLRKGEYIDLTGNENVDRMSFLSEELRHNPATEFWDYSLMHKVGTSGAHNKGKTIVIQEHPGTPRNQTDHRPDKTPGDDIPMEIVELMAKNQYERYLPDCEDDDNNHKRPSQVTSTSKNTLLIDLNKTYENGVSQEDSNNTSSQPKPHSRNPGKEEHLLTRKLNSVGFFSKSQFNQPYLPPGCGILSHSPESLSSSIQFPGIRTDGQTNAHDNCHRLGKMDSTANHNASSSSLSVLRPCNTCQSVPRQYQEASRHLWPYTVRHNHIPVSDNISQKFMDHSTKLDMLSWTPNNDPNSWNLNFRDPGKQKHWFDSELSFGCKHGGTNRCLEPYSNESCIPAMHLLSLLDPRLRSNMPVDLDGNSKLPKRPSFYQVHRSKEFAGIQPQECNTCITQESIFDSYGKKFSPETSHGTFPSISRDGTMAFSFQNDQSFTKCSDFTAQASINHQKKNTKRKNNILPTYVRQKPVFASGNLGNFQFHGSSDSAIPLKFHMSENARKQKGKKNQTYNSTVWPTKSCSGSIICHVNRNPADFTVAEPGNAYMIKGKDLKERKRSGSGKRTGLYNGRKQKNKLAASAAANDFSTV